MHTKRPDDYYISFVNCQIPEFAVFRRFSKSYFTVICALSSRRLPVTTMLYPKLVYLAVGLCGILTRMIHQIYVNKACKPCITRIIYILKQVLFMERR